MRQLPYSLIILLLVFCSTSGLFAQVEKSKTIEKSYDVNRDVEVALTNKYGEIDIETWDQNRLVVVVTITVEKTSEKKAQQYLDQIDIDISESSNSYEFETEIDGSLNMRGGEELSIDYEVKMPKTANLYSKVSYGSLYMDDLSGDAELRIAYGNMKVDELNGNTELKLSYGNGKIEKMSDGELSISYSNIEIKEMQDADVVAQYSNVEIGKSKDVTLSNKYGSFEVDEVYSLDGNLKYGNLDIERLFKSLILSMAYGNGVRVDWISKDFEKIDIEAEHASTVLSFEKGFSADVEGYFKYADLKFSDDFEFSYVSKSSSSAEYKGKIGEGSGDSKVRLNSKYGNVKIGYSR